jgi:hypothetical protein
VHLYDSSGNDDDVLASDRLLPKLEYDEERYHRHQSPDNGECISMHSWQDHVFPVCNSIHEMDFFSKLGRGDGGVVHITNGGFNDLYHYTERYVNDTSSEITSESLALKILLYQKDYTQHKFGVVRQDSVTLERLTFSKNVYPIYGYCGFVMTVPFLTGGTLDDLLRSWRNGEVKLTSRQRLQYALDAARGLRDLHNVDGDGVPSVTHGDLKEHQYLFGEDGRLMLGDFNKGQCICADLYSFRVNLFSVASDKINILHLFHNNNFHLSLGQFLSKSSTTSKPCTYKPPSSSYNDKVFRSPEEYKNIQQTAATDVFALGSIFYYLLTKQRVWEGYHDKRGLKKARGWIIQGYKPKIDRKILKSKDPVDVALLHVYELCTRYKPEERASAIDVAEYLEGVWNDLY